MLMKKRLVLFGDSAFAEIAYEYFTHDSNYDVVAFTVNKQFIKQESLFGLPVVPFEEVEMLFPPQTHDMHVALVYNQLNRVRRRIYTEAKLKGYTLANYISSKSFVWHNVTLGDNVFIFEDNTIQPFVRMDANIVLWSGNHIGHHSFIGSHNFISSHVVISGFCTIGKSCFFGVNATIGNNVEIGDDCFLGAGTMVTRSLLKGSFVKARQTDVDEKSTYVKFGVDPL
ncbi:MAG: acetyltransferase [Cytophagia bacterium]|nr:acetyltransferase [Cytophagia bacterium]